MRNIGTAAIIALFTTAACTSDAAKTTDTAVVANTPPPAAVAGPVDSTATVNAVDGGGSGTMIDPNTATAGDLATVQGVTPDIAAAVVAGRPYSDMTAVDKVLAKTLDEKQRDCGCPST
jgi:DNA uptake protein ComE-like DNA-binding protein